VFFSLATGAAIALVIDVMNTHDIQLARKLYQFLNQGDILLGDRAFCAYADLLSLKNLGCDAVFRKHQSRTTSIRKGKIIGDCDKLVTWYKPKICPKGLSKDEFVALPQSLTVREIYYYIVIRVCQIDCVKGEKLGRKAIGKLDRKSIERRFPISNWHRPFFRDVLNR
jgi:hypothetical protein